MFRKLLAVALAAVLTGCAAQRAQVAQDAQQQMRGLTKEQVLSCMGPPANRAAEGKTEVWSYSSGGETLITGHSSMFGTANAYSTPGGAFAQGVANSNSFGMAQQRYCVVNVVISGGTVSTVNYSGPTGGIFTGGEQCAYAVRNCVRQ